MVRRQASAGSKGCAKAGTMPAVTPVLHIAVSWGAQLQRDVRKKNSRGQKAEAG